MNAKILHGLVIFLGTGSVAFYQRYHEKSWWLWALITTLFLAVLADGIGDYSIVKRSAGLTNLNRLIIFSASVFMSGVAVYDGFRGNGWVFPLFLSLMLLFFVWTAGLPDPEPAVKEAGFNPDSPPQIPFKEVLFTGSDSDFTYYIHEFFPFTDWKDGAEETLEQFLPHLSEFSFEVLRHQKKTDVLLKLRDRSETVTLEIGPEAALLIEPLAHFLAPEYILCSYYFTEGSDTWANPIFSAAIWDRLKRERPDRAALFTPYIEHRTLSKGPKRANS